MEPTTTQPQQPVMMQPSDIPPEKLHRTRGINRATVILSVILVLFVGGVAAGFATGYVALRDPHNGGPANGGVCSSLISAYNKAINTTPTKGSDTITVLADQQKALADVAKQAAALPGNENDPNCVQMRLASALRQQDTASIKNLAARIESLAQSGRYATAQLSNPMGVDTVQTIQQSLNDNPASSTSGTSNTSGTSSQNSTATPQGKG